MFEIMDKTDWKVLNKILDNPYKTYYLRELSKEVGVSPSSVKKALDKASSLGLIKEESRANLRIISGNTEETLFKYMKLIKNIALLKELAHHYKNALTITLYGSFAQGTNNTNSDIDLFILTNKKHEHKASYKGYELQIQEQTPTEWAKTKKDNPAYAKEIMRGIVLRGEPLP